MHVYLSCKTVYLLPELIYYFSLSLFSFYRFSHKLRYSKFHTILNPGILEARLHCWDYGVAWLKSKLNHLRFMDRAD
jgi:hypothetical protein